MSAQHDTKNTAFADIAIRPAEEQELRRMSFVWHTAYKQKDEEEITPPSLAELNRMYDEDGRQMFENAWHVKQNKFLIATVPEQRVSIKILDKDKKTMAGICEYNRETIHYPQYGEQTAQDVDALYIEKIYTVKTRKSPVGKALLLECVNIAKEMGVKAIIADTATPDSRDWVIDSAGFEKSIPGIRTTQPQSGRKSRLVILHQENFDRAIDMLSSPKAKNDAPKAG